MPTSTPEQHSTRERILKVLRATGRAMTTAEVARRIQVHPNTVRFHLDTLIERGQVEQVEAPPRGPGRPALRVRAVAGMDPQGPRHYRLLAEALTLALAAGPDPAAQAQQAGRAWGARIVAAEREAGRSPADATAPTDVSAAGESTDGTVAADPITALTHMLDDLGFEPERRSDAEIDLHNCPFLELTNVSREVVCSVHLGLMRGALEELRADAEVSDLVPFARPDLCVAHLGKGCSAA